MSTAPTPRTDEILERIAAQSPAYQSGALEEHARQLERELNELTKQLPVLPK